MSKEKTKECSKCELILPVSEFHKDKKSKDGFDSYCKFCRNDYLSEWRLKKYRRDPYKYLLYSSCTNAFNRGQPDYIKPPYNHVTCEWDSVSDFFNELCNDVEWMKEWRCVTDKYLETGLKEDKPSINRKNPQLGYSRDNIEVQSLGDNVREARSQPCQLLFIPQRNMSHIKLHSFSSKQNLKQFLADRGIPVNTIRHLDEGIIHEVKPRNPESDCFIIQSKNGELKNRNEPLYRLEFKYEKYLIDNYTKEEWLIAENKYSYLTGGLRLNYRNT